MRQLKGRTRLIMYAGVSKPNPKLGQSLGPLGMNMMQFCKEFNDKTNYFRPDVPLRILLTAYTDRTYEYKIKPPPCSWYIKRLGQRKHGVDCPDSEIIGTISVKYIYELAKLKREFDEDFKGHSVKGIVKCIIGQMNSMGFDVVLDAEPLSDLTPSKF